MILETDVLYAFVKEEDWLKPVATKLIEKIARGEYERVYVSRECIHELYYVSIEEGVDLNEVISRIGALTAIDNLTFLETTQEIDLTALTLMNQYKFTSIFDAYYAATALEQDPDRRIVSTDDVFDRVPGLEREDPRELVKA